MKTSFSLGLISLALLLVSCADKGVDALPPRAIVVPLTSAVDAVSGDAAQVETASRKTRDAVRDTGAAIRENTEAGERAKQENEKLAASGKKMAAQIDRLEILSKDHQGLAAEVVVLKEISATQAAQQESLTNALVWWQGKAAVAEAQAKFALETVDEQEVTVGQLMLTVIELEKKNAEQASQLAANKRTDDFVRDVAKSNLAAQADLIIAEDKLEWWRWRFAPIAIVCLILATLFIFRPSIL